MLYFHLLVLFPVWQLSQKSVGPRGWSWVTAKRKESRTKWTATEGKVTHVTLMWVGGAHQQEVIQPGRVRWHQWHHWIALAPVNDFFLFDEIHSSEIKRYVLYVNFFESVSWKAMIWLCHCCVLMVNLLLTEKSEITPLGILENPGWLNQGSSARCVGVTYSWLAKKKVTDWHRGRAWHHRGNDIRMV